MLKLYSWPTPNHYKVTFLLRELQAPYELNVVAIGKGEQFSDEFLKLCPNNKIPVLVDSQPVGGRAEPLVLFESGCILEYLADKAARFLPPLADPRRYDVLKWLYWQMAGLGPMLGQNHHFTHYASEQIPYAIDRYQKETTRLYTVLNHQLANKEYVVGSELSIADMAIYPWIVPYQKQGQKLENYPELKRWFDALSLRKSVVEAYEEGSNVKQGQETVTEEAKKFLFGQTGSHLK